MTSSPPQEPLDIRWKSLTPQSPKPILRPSPSNIPLLHRQMDPSAATSVIPDDTNQSTHPATEQQNDSQEDASGSSDSGAEPSVDHENTIQNLEHVSNFQVDGDQKDESTKLANLNAGINEASSISSTSNSNAPESHEAAVVIISEPLTSQFIQQPSIIPNGEHDYISLSNDNAIPPSLESIVPSGVNIQALLDQLAPSLSAKLPPTESTAQVSIVQEPVSPSISNQAASLPPRPPPQENTSTNPDFIPLEDIKSYHPHSQPNVSGPFQAHDSVPAYVAPSSVAHHPLPSPGFLKSPALNNGGIPNLIDEDDAPFSAEQDRQYDQFIREERTNVAEGNWDKFPDGSRLFIGKKHHKVDKVAFADILHIGNLPTEKVSKRDVFRRFSKYGKLGQISLKQAYGFVQYLEASSCSRALDAEQDRPLKGRKMRKSLQLIMTRCISHTNE
jgi:hypothetical protein